MVEIAEKRMFAKTIIDSDAFLDMPQSTQLLYFHLSMRGDDDGFINNPKSIMRNVKCSEDDLKIMIAKKFIIPFESGIVVIKHWKIHNYIAKDRYKETKYKKEKSHLSMDENSCYSLDKTPPYTECIQDVDGMDTQVRLDEISIDKIEGNKAKPTKIKYADRVSLTEEEYKKLIEQYSEKIIKEKIIDLDLWKGSKGKATKSDYLTLLAWLRKDCVSKKDATPNKPIPAGNFNY